MNSKFTTASSSIDCTSTWVQNAVEKFSCQNFQNELKNAVVVFLLYLFQNSFYRFSNVQIFFYHSFTDQNVKSKLKNSLLIFHTVYTSYQTILQFLVYAYLHLKFLHINFVGLLIRISYGTTQWAWLSNNLVDKDIQQKLHICYLDDEAIFKPNLMKRLHKVFEIITLRWNINISFERRNSVHSHLNYGSQPFYYSPSLGLRNLAFTFRVIIAMPQSKGYIRYK